MSAVEMDYLISYRVSRKERVTSEIRNRITTHEDVVNGVGWPKRILCV